MSFSAAQEFWHAFNITLCWYTSALLSCPNPVQPLSTAQYHGFVPCGRMVYKWQRGTTMIPAIIMALQHIVRARTAYSD
eukprot:1777160-Rhodomonas_salina.1